MPDIVLLLARLRVLSGAGEEAWFSLGCGAGGRRLKRSLRAAERIASSKALRSMMLTWTEALGEAMLPPVPRLVGRPLRVTPPQLELGELPSKADPESGTLTVVWTEKFLTVGNWMVCPQHADGASTLAAIDNAISVQGIEIQSHRIRNIGNSSL
jgi:hypothetical protein